MRKILSYTTLLVVSCFASGLAAAQTNNHFDPTGTLILPSNSSSYNQQGFNLPSAPRSSGQDVVRGAGGVSCQSAVNGNGPLLDMGVIGTNDIFSRESAAVYGRITVALGKKAKRVDCTKLYDMEIERLRMELQMMRAGTINGAGNLNNQDQLRQMMLQAERNEKFEAVTAPVQMAETPQISPLVVGGAPMAVAETELLPAPAKPESAPVIDAVLEPPAPVAQIEKPRAEPVSPPPEFAASAPALAKPVARKSDIPSRIVIEKKGNPGSSLTEDECGYYAQLGAYSNLKNVKKAWQQIKAKMPDIISDFETVAKTKEKGGSTLYLLRVGPFSKSKSADVCKHVEGGCYPIGT
ncbi:MAG: SPOR domain-containing protein [Acidimicrobiales bacterium]|nr:hypothetical protein [Hyphomonadaceae bacterium]RZV44426.1 MAG: SPOR domain-containing protein [Acidimicrobiales bacterium]